MAALATTHGKLLAMDICPGTGSTNAKFLCCYFIGWREKHFHFLSRNSPEVGSCA
jgi:hypothetical protein